MYCIYQISNKINGKRYIGQHKYTDENNPMGQYKGSGKLLKLAYKKYGEENFETEILYKRIRDQETVDAMEIWAIAKYKPEYNIAKGGTGGDTFSGHSDEWKTNRKKQMSDWLKNHNPDFNPISKQKMLDGIKAFYEKNGHNCSYGKPHSEDHNKHVQESLKRFYNCHSGHAKGTKFTKEHSSKISQSRKGYKWWNNGEISIQAKEQPEGFVRGFAPKDREKRKGHTPWNKGKKGLQVAWNKGKTLKSKNLEGDNKGNEQKN